jgi:hypothetical protein
VHVSLCGNERHLLKYLAEGVALAAEPAQTVDVTLDLETSQPPIYDCQVYTGCGPGDVQFM